MSRVRTSMCPALPAAVALLALVMVACTGGSGDGAGRVATVAPDAAEVLALPKAEELATEFGPASIRVHPLSRWESAGSETKARPRAIVHVELLDAIGRGITWPGVLIVAVGAEQRALDLRSMSGNDGAYDRITRTYTATFENVDRGGVRVRFRAAPGSTELRAEGVLREVGQ